MCLQAVPSATGQLRLVPTAIWGQHSGLYSGPPAGLMDPTILFLEEILEIKPALVCRSPPHAVAVGLCLRRSPFLGAGRGLSNTHLASAH